MPILHVEKLRGKGGKEKYQVTEEAPLPAWNAETKLATVGQRHPLKPQIEQAMYGNMMYVEPGGQELSYSQQMESAAAAYPEATLTRFRPSEASNHLAEVGIQTADGRNLTVYANPHTSAVIGDRNDDTTLPAIAERIHGTLLIGTVGDRIVEPATCWALVLSGLYLPFPRKTSTIWGTLLPRLRARGRTR